MTAIKRFKSKNIKCCSNCFYNFSETLVGQERDGQINSHEQTWNGFYNTLLLLMAMHVIDVVSRQTTRMYPKVPGQYL